MKQYSRFEAEMNFQIFLQQQEQRWKLHVRESMSALIDLCKQTILNAKAICVMAADILDMSKRTPSCVGDEPLDLSAYVNPAIIDLANIDTCNLPESCTDESANWLHKRVGFVVEYVVI